jgi:hypothetical protein
MSCFLLVLIANRLFDLSTNNRLIFSICAFVFALASYIFLQNKLKTEERSNRNYVVLTICILATIGLGLGLYLYK